MSEKLLESIIQLFAIIAKQDEVTHGERKQIEQYLYERLSHGKVLEYMEQFNRYAQNFPTHEDEKIKIKDVCNNINLGLTHKQKIILLGDLIELIKVDNKISDLENYWVYFVCKEINIDNKFIEVLKNFAIIDKEKDSHSGSLLVVDADIDNNITSTKKAKTENLEGFIAILRLKKHSIYFVKYHGNATLYLNSIPLKEGRPYVFGTGSVIRSDKINPIFYSDVVANTQINVESEKITFEARDITYRFKNGEEGLKGVSLMEEHGTLIGIMGSSGSGKSTLLNVLNGNEKPFSGQVFLNGLNIHDKTERKKIEGLIGYVPQDDFLIEELSVFENMYYPAKLCFGHSNDLEVVELVKKTLKNLGLSEIQGMIVGSPLKKAISGGQRKRLNIGLELLREPSVLFVDEPTSGLSSRDSENVMDLLKELTLKGNLIFVVIHQPSSDIFKMFDNIIILDTSGYQIYYGNPIESVVYFKNQINLLDRDNGVCTRCGNVNPEQIFNIIEERVLDEYGYYTDIRRNSPEYWAASFIKTFKKKSVNRASPLPQKNFQIPNYLVQFLIFSTRDLLSKVKNKQYMVINLLESPLLALILCGIIRYYPSDYLGGEYNFYDNVNIPVYFFMSVIVALFIGLTVSAEEIFKDGKILKREAFLNLSRGSYLSSKILILFSLSAIQSFSFILVGNLLLKVQGQLFNDWLILFSTSCFANVLGLNISSAFNSTVTIYILIPILLIPQFILSGVVVEFKNLNPVISNKEKVPIIGEFMVSRWAFETAMVNQFMNNDYEKPVYKLDKIRANAEYKYVYHIPYLESKLQSVFYWLNDRDPEKKETMKHNLAVVRNEIKDELNIVGTDKFSELSKLTLEKYDVAVYKEAYSFLQTMKNLYSSRYNKAAKEKNKFLKEQGNAILALKKKYANERVITMLENKNTTNRIFELKDHLVQHVYPIYHTPEIKNISGLSSHFYAPEKPFFGVYISTFTYNLCVIWFMTIILAVLLYFDVLKKIISR